MSGMLTWAKLARDSVDAALMALDLGAPDVAARRLVEAERAVRELMCECPAWALEDASIDQLGPSAPEGGES